jgi:hypothetical protein
LTLGAGTAPTPPGEARRRGVVPEPLRVEAPNEDLAHALMRRLRAFPTELRDADDCVEVRLAGRQRRRAIVDVLQTVDGWLLENELSSVRIHLDDRVYTLTPPAAER